MNRFAFESNIEFNPLFEKMRERFCAEGTVAEQLAKRAAEYKKSSAKRPTAEQHMKVGNSLPKNAPAAATKKRKFFTLGNVGSACMLLLVAGTVLFSGAAIGTLRDGSAEGATVLENRGARAEDSMVLFENVASESVQNDFELLDHSALI